MKKKIYSDDMKFFFALFHLDEWDNFVWKE